MRRAHGVLVVFVVLLACAAAGGIVLLWPKPDRLPQAVEQTQATRLLDGKITSVRELGEADLEGLSQSAQALEISTRLADGREVTFEMTDETGGTFTVGQAVRVAEVESPDGGDPVFYINDIRRERPLLVLAALFLVAVLAFGRLQGVRALIGLGITITAIVLFVVPAILTGADPILVALSASVAVMIVTLYLSHGFSAKTTAAVVGTIGALGITVLLAWVFVQAATLTGLSDEEARLASLEVSGLSLRGLLLAGIIIGALGVLDDVTIAQSSTVFELHRRDPEASYGELVAGALNVGRDHVAATINTLFLAYAGAALPLLILFTLGADSLTVIASSEVVAIEIVRTLVGSVGLITAVPLTSALAAALVRERSVEPFLEPALEPSLEPPRGYGRRSRPQHHDDLTEVLVDRRPLTSDQEPESEWEERLRQAYGIDHYRSKRDRSP